MAEEVGVEPTKHFNSTSTALKAAHTTGCDALPWRIIPKVQEGFAGTAVVGRVTGLRAFS